MFFWIKEIINKIQNRFFLNKSESYLIKYFDKLREKKFEKEHVLISAQLDDNYFFIKNFIISSYLSKYKNLSICYFINFHNLISQISFKRKIRNFFIYNYFSFLKMKKKYGSFCDEYFFNFYYIKPKRNYFEEKKIKELHIKEISNFKYRNIKIGDLCIDTYLQTFHNFLIFNDLDSIKNDKKFKITFNTACAIVDEFFIRFEEKKITSFLTSYSGYIDHGLGLRVALFFKCKIFIIGDIDKAFIITNSAYHKYNYEKILLNFKKLSNQNKKIYKATNYLKRRFIGQKDLAIDYLSFVPYKKTEKKLPNLRLKKSICIFTHYTADSLYGFKETKFLTQKNWLEETLKNLDSKIILEKINVFIKIHPNETIQGEIYLKKIFKKYPFINVLEKNTNINQIINSNLIAGITLHGTIGLELAYHGIKTLYGHYNPYINFKFCLYKKNKKDYFQDLKKIYKFKRSDKHKDEASIYYYMNNFYSPNKNLKNFEILELKEIFYRQKELNFRFINDYITHLHLNRVYKKLNILEKCFNDGII